MDRVEFSKQLDKVFSEIRNNIKILYIDKDIHTFNILTSLHRLKISIIESLYIKKLKKDVNDNIEYVLNDSAEKISLKDKIFQNKIYKIAILFYFILFKRVRNKIFNSKIKNKKVNHIKNIFFISSDEIKKTKIDNKKYIYHKYLEGLIDFEHTSNDTLIVLYGSNSDYLSFKNVYFFDYRKYYNFALNSKSKQILSNMFEKRKILSKKGNELVSILDTIVYQDSSLILFYEKIISQLSNVKNIYLDSFDSTLFSFSQYLLKNTKLNVIGIQKVLGPFSFSYVFDKKIYKIPNKMIVWSEFEKDNILKLKYDNIKYEIRCNYKLVVYKKYNYIKKEDIKRRLGIKQKKVIMFSVLQNILGYNLVKMKDFLKYLKTIAQIAREQDVFIIFKGWPGSDPNFYKKITRDYLGLKPKQYHMIVDSKMEQNYHNLELIKATDVLITTMSSFISEAVYYKVPVIMVSTNESKKYFTDEIESSVSKVTHLSERADDFYQLVLDILYQDDAKKEQYFKDIDNDFKYLFGEVK